MQQLVRRYAEDKKCQSNLEEIKIYIGPIKMQKEFDYRPITQDGCYPQFSGWKTENFVLKLNKANNCVKMKTGDLLLIENFVTSKFDKSILIIGRKYEKVTEVFSEPCSSQLLNIHCVSQLSHLQSWNLTDIEEKMIHFPMTNSEKNFIIMPLLHLQ